MHTPPYSDEQHSPFDHGMARGTGGWDIIMAHHGWPSVHSQCEYTYKNISWLAMYCTFMIHSWANAVAIVQKQNIKKSNIVHVWQLAGYLTDSNVLHNIVLQVKQLNIYFSEKLINIYLYKFKYLF